MKYNKGSFLIIPNKEKIRWCEPITQVVYMRLCDFSDKNMKSFPSFSTLSKCSWCSRSAVIRAIKKLEEIGVVKKTQRCGTNGKISNLYEVIITTDLVSVWHHPSVCGTLPSVRQTLPLVSDVPIELYPYITTPNKLNSPPAVDLKKLMDMYPHARTARKGNTMKNLAKLDYEDCLYAIKILKREVELWVQNHQFVKWMELRARDFVKLSDAVNQKKLLEIYKLIKEWENVKETILRFAEDFGKEKTEELYTILEKQKKAKFISSIYTNGD